MSLPRGFSDTSIIPYVIWPDPNGAMDGLKFWAAVLDPTLSWIYGGDEGIVMISFGFGS